MTGLKVNSTCLSLCLSLSYLHKNYWTENFSTDVSVVK